MNLSPECGSFNFPLKYNRRSMLTGAATVPVLGGAMALAGVSGWSDLTDEEDKRLVDALKSLRQSTGISMDKWVDWLTDVPVSEIERISSNATTVETS